MPEEIEKKLKEEARKLGLKGERFNAYVYGTLRKHFGWTPKKQNKK